jgi:hypothetical protein
MTIPSENYRNDEIGNGATDTYNYTFKITSEDEIKVSQRDTDDVETELTLNVDYTVTGVGALNGGSIVLTAGNLTTDYHLTIRRDSDLTQLTDVRNQGDFFPEVHEDTFDHLASVSLTQQSEIDRSVKISETYPDVSVELPGPQAGKVLKWNDAGTALINVDTGDAQIAVPADDSVTPAKIQNGLPFVFPETLVLKRGADVASASGLPVINDGNYVDVTGSTDIDSIDSIGVGTWLLVQFDAALNLNHSAVDLFLCAGGANILTAAGDHALFVEYGIGTWRCVSYIKANGQPIVLTGITFTNPVLAAATLNTSVAGTAFQDDDTFASAAPDKFASSESIKAYVDAEISAKSGFEIFDSSGTFTVPAEITKVFVSGVAGGGGGGFASTSVGEGGGGGAGGRAGMDFLITVTPEEEISVTIGASGIGATSGSGGSGGDTMFAGYVTFTGGAGGDNGSGGAAETAGQGLIAGAGGASDSPGGDSLYYLGGAVVTTGGGGGGASLYGHGGIGGAGGTGGNGGAGDANTGAGGGGGGYNSGDGGDGGSGKLIVRW